MRIVHLSTSDTAGGAARAAYRVHTGLRRLGHDSRMLVLRKVSDDPGVSAFVPPRNFFSRLVRRIRRRSIKGDYLRYQRTLPAGVELFSDDRAESGRDLLRQIPQCDIINLHWVPGLVDCQAFFAGIGNTVPLVWRLADMWAMTGGCHYDDNCGRFTKRCGACPQLGSTDEHDLSRDIWQRKSGALANTNLHLVATSNWIAAQAKRSALLGDFKVTVIPNGLDTEVFAPRDRDFARHLWGIPQNAKVVLFASESLSNRRKGLAYLVEALKQIQDVSNVLLVSVGGDKIALDPAVPYLALGRINNDRVLSSIYSAADVFVMPSLQESFGQTVIESMACGTPVVGFATGGIPDMVRPGQTGWLVGTGNARALSSTIREALSSGDATKKMSATCRRVAEQEYSLDVQARAYVQLYESLQPRAHGAPLAKASLAPT